MYDISRLRVKVMLLFICLLFSLALQPSAGYGLLVHEVSRSHITMRHSCRNPGRVVSSSQRPLPDNTQHTQQTNIHAPGGIRIHDRSRRVAADLRLKPRGHWDRQGQIMHCIITHVSGMCSYLFKISSEIQISNSGHISYGHFVFTCEGMWESVVIFCCRKGSASKNFAKHCAALCTTVQQNYLYVQSTSHSSWVDCINGAQERGRRAVGTGSFLGVHQVALALTTHPI
jgi:hypothetical protein